MTFKDIVTKHEQLRCKISDHTRWNGFNFYSPAEVERLFKHVDECHAVLRELTGIADWQAPFRIPEVRERAEMLLKEIA